MKRIFGKLMVGFGRKSQDSNASSDVEPEAARIGNLK
jgi:hypothetical protein